MKTTVVILIIILVHINHLHSQEITINAPTSVGTKDYHSISISPTGNAIIVGNGIIVHSDASGTRITESEETVYNDVTYISGTVFLVVTSSGSIKRSSDNGNTWNTVHNQKHTLNSVYFANSLAIAVGDYGTILISEDEGLTWQNQKRKTSEHLYSTFIQENNTYCVGNGGTIIYSTDKGKNWECKEGIMRDDFRFITFTNSSIGFVGGTNGSIYRSDNSGKTWTTILSDTTFSFQNCYNGNNLLIATGNEGALYISSDNGNNWNKNNLPFHKEWTNAASSIGNEIVVVGDRGTVYKGRNNSWTKNTNTPMNSDLFCISKNADRIFVGGANGSLFYSSDNGKTWNDAGTNSTQDVSAIIHNNNEVYAFNTADSSLLHSSDKGNSWTLKKLPANSILTAKIYTDNGNKKYTFFAGGNGIYYSENFTDWFIAAENLNIKTSTLYSIEGIDSDKLYAVGEKGLLLRYEGGGTNWSLINPLTDKNLYDIALSADGKDIIAIGEKGTAIYSEDNGNSWQKILVDTLTWKSVVADDARKRFILTSIEGIIYAGKNNSWEKLVTTGNIMFNSAVFDENMWLCGVDGYIGSLPLTASYIQSDDNVKSDNIQIRYNATEERIYIVNKSTQAVNVSLYTTGGISTSLRCELGSDMKKEFNTHQMASGVYHCIVRIGNQYIYKSVLIAR